MVMSTDASGRDEKDLGHCQRDGTHLRPILSIAQGGWAPIAESGITPGPTDAQQNQPKIIFLTRAAAL